MYTDKVVIITGGSKGIGKGCVEVFVGAGAKVVFCARNSNEGEALAKSLNSGGPGEAMFFQCDVSRVDEIQNLINTAIEKHQRLDCLINNAGWHPPHKPIDGFLVAEFNEIMALNLVSIFAPCKLAVLHLQQTKWNIINLSNL